MFVSRFVFGVNCVAVILVCIVVAVVLAAVAAVSASAAAVVVGRVGRRKRQLKKQEATGKRGLCPGRGVREENHSYNSWTSGKLGSFLSEIQQYFLSNRQETINGYGVYLDCGAR